MALIERWWPYLVTALWLAFWYWPLDRIFPANPTGLLAASGTASAVLVGLLATANAIIIGLGEKVVELITTAGEARERLSQYAYTTLEPGNPLGLLQEALELAEANAPLEKRLRQAHKEGLVRSEYLGLQIDEALTAEVITADEAAALRDFHEKVFALLSVDDFAPEELGRAGAKPTSDRPRKAAKRKAAPRKKTSSRKKKPAASSPDA
mgnify:CR=1 FL=1